MTDMLVAHTGTHHVAVPVTTVDEVVHRASTTSVPGSPAWFDGLLLARGRTDPCIDLRCLLDGTGVAPAASDRIIRCSSAGGALALIVEATVGMVTVEEIEPSRRELIIGTVRVEDTVVLVLDIDEIIRRTRAALPGSVGTAAWT